MIEGEKVEEYLLAELVGTAWVFEAGLAEDGFIRPSIRQSAWISAGLDCPAWSINPSDPSINPADLTDPADPCIRESAKMRGALG